MLRNCYCVDAIMTVEKLKWKKTVCIILAKDQFLMCHCLFHLLISRVQARYILQKVFANICSISSPFIVAC